MDFPTSKEAALITHRMLKGGVNIPRGRVFVSAPSTPAPKEVKPFWNKEEPKPMEVDEEKLQRQMDESFAREGIVRPARGTTATPDSATPENIARLCDIGDWVEKCDMPEVIRTELQFLVQLCHSTIFERSLLETEIDSWRKRCDDLLYNFLASNIRKGTLRQ